MADLDNNIGLNDRDVRHVSLDWQSSDSTLSGATVIAPWHAGSGQLSTIVRRSIPVNESWEWSGGGPSYSVEQSSAEEDDAGPDANSDHSGSLH